MSLTSLPTRADQPSATGIGRAKTNDPDHPATDLDVDYPAEEHEKIKDYVIDTATEVGLHDGSTVGSLNARVKVLETLPTLHVTGTHTLVPGTDVVLFVDTTGGSRTLNLPDPSTSVGKGYLVIDEDNNAESNPITLARFGSTGKIDNATGDKLLQADGGRWWVWTDGTNWFTTPAGLLSTDAALTINGNAGTAGNSQEASPANHKHQVQTGTPSSMSARANAAGSGPALVMNDHSHAIALTVQSFSSNGTIATATGVCLIDTGAGGRQLTLPDPAVVNAFLPIWLIHTAGSSTSLQLIRHGSEKIDGSAGTKNLLGVADHLDRYFVWTDGTDWYTGCLAPPDVTTTPTAVTASAGSAGTGQRAAAVDHVHQVTTAAPTGLARANSAGSSASLARADHIHDAGDGVFNYLAAGTSSLPEADFINADTSGGAITINLPSSPVLTGSCRSYSIKKTTTDVNAITLHPSGSQLIEGVNANLALPGSTATTRPSWTIVYDPNDDAWWVF